MKTLPTLLLATLHMTLFEHFPNAAVVKVEYLTATGQGAAAVSRERPELVLN